MLNKGTYPSGGRGTLPYTFSDEATRRKIKRHLTDINDVITEIDIKNVKVPGAEENSDLQFTTGQESKKKNQIVDDSPGNPVTPWNVLSE